MTDKEIGLYLSRILSGYYIIFHNNEKYKIVYPDINVRYQAELFAEEHYHQNKFNDWIRDEDIVAWLVDMGIWTWDGDDSLKKIENGIENLKVELYQSLLNPAQTKRIRRQLSTQKSLLNSKFSIRHSFDGVTVQGYVDMLKNQFILINSIYDHHNKLLFNDLDNIDYALLNDISGTISNYSINMSDFRKIARHEMWRNYWSSNKNNVFDKSSVNMTDEQKTLVILTKMYDGAYEHPECPPDNVIEDDDMFDGWLIHQRREMEKSRNKSRNDKLLESKKLSNAQEVFLVAKTKEEAQAIYGLNDQTERHIIKERFEAIDKNKEIKDSDLPDVRRDIITQTNQQVLQKHRNK